MTNFLDTRRKSILSLVLAVLVLGSAGSAVTFTASAAGSTTVSLSPAEQQIEPGETTTYEVVVENTDGGIGTTDAAVTLDDPSVGTITDLSITGEPANQNVAIADDGSSVDFDAIYFGNALSDDDSVVIATVTVEGTATGSSDLSLDVAEISDSAGDVYEVTGTDGASLAVGSQETTTETETPTATPTATETETATETSTTETTTETETSTTETTTETETTATETTTETETETDTSEPGTTTATETTTDTTTPTETQTTTPTETQTTTTQTPTETTTTDEEERTLDARSIADSLSESGLSTERIEGVGSALDASGLTDEEITAITDALAGDGLTDAQREAVADAIASGDLTDDQLRALADALSDGRLTDAERDALGFLSGGATEETYYQIDFVVGESIENLQGPNGTYQNDELLRFAHGSTAEPITRRSEGEFITDASMADRIESRNITVENGTATTTFTVDDGESVTLTLASYEKIGPGWSPETESQQTFVDSETRTFESGTHTLTVDLPDENDASGEDESN
ncbi:hypothetical protein C450_15098 [Halococcus salifodinae DSM 8989]|uniref:Uncharacterized protein n=1 Tax=Halococcus salifodinae DSM 8989 TaxID=1227456 RepID=M0N022_9EURY|nr:hypothetical protein C450_15098 [Halococcus salifodinae DSM 8989]